jgi:hypothetical protein
MTVEIALIPTAPVAVPGTQLPWKFNDKVNVELMHLHYQWSSSLTPKLIRLMLRHTKQQNNMKLGSLA